jgi:hypothetical protein
MSVSCAASGSAAVPCCTRVSHRALGPGLTDEDILGIVSRQKELNFSRGSDFDYSNTNYTYS